MSRSGRAALKRAAAALAIWAAVATATATAQVAERSAASGPDSREMEAEARAALPRAVIRALRGKVLDIKGLQSVTTGRVADLNDIASQLSRSAPGLTARVSGTELRLNIPDRVLFDFDKSALRSEAVPTLQAVAEAASRAGDLPIRVEGHTDAKGSEPYNQRLSELRAGAVEGWLEAAGLADVRVTAQGFGSRRPIAPNVTPQGRDDPEGRQKNRRVEIVIGR